MTPLTVKFSPPALAGESQSAIKPLTGWENVKESKFVPLPQDVELGVQSRTCMNRSPVSLPMKV